MNQTLICIRADGGRVMGMGHLNKMAILARALKNLGRTYEIRFYIRKDRCGYDWIKRNGFLPKQIPASISRSQEPRWLLNRVRRPEQTVFLVDILDTPKGYLKHLKDAGAKVITFENLSPYRYEADAVVNAIVNGPRSYKRQTKESLFVGGSQYRVFHPDFECYASRPLQKKKISRNVLISLGGGHDGGIAKHLGRAILSRSLNTSVTVIQGPASKKYYGPRDQNRLKILGPQKSLARSLSKATVAVSAGGGTLYELALIGVPGVALYKNVHERKNIRAFQRAGTVLDAGKLNRAGVPKAVNRVLRLLQSKDALIQMRLAGKRLVDGQGLKRVVQLVQHLAKGGKHG